MLNMTEAAKPTLKELETKLKQVDKEIKEAEERNWTADAQEILDKMAQEFVPGTAYINNSKEFVPIDLHVTSPIGGIRNLWRAITGRPGIVAAAKRRATNSPIQGFSSEVGATTAYLILVNFDRYRRKFKLPLKLFIKYLRAVHDANYYSVPYEVVLSTIQIVQYTATYGVANWYKKVFGFTFLVEPEIEMDMGANDAEGHTWDWALSGSKDCLGNCLFNAVIDQYTNGVLESKAEVKDALMKIIRPWEDEEHRTYLNTKYPLLNVPNLEPLQLKMVADIKKKYTEWANSNGKS
jgi:hypothetical protein